MVLCQKTSMKYEIHTDVYPFVVPLLETVNRNLNPAGNEKRKSEVGGSYLVTKHGRKPSHSRTKIKLLIIDRTQEAS